VLRWEIRTREFVVALPKNNKYLAWKGDLVRRNDRERDGDGPRSRIYGRAPKPCVSHHPSQPALSKQDKEESPTGEAECLGSNTYGFLRKSSRTNSYGGRTPTQIAWSDSCPFGIGGYTLKGCAWRIRALSEAFYGDDTVNNVLEFLGMAVSVPLLLEEARRIDGEQFPCLLVLGDNTSAISWIFKSGKIARTSRYFGASSRYVRPSCGCKTLRTTPSRSNEQNLGPPQFRRGVQREG
jgi:hypothetical protein